MSVSTKTPCKELELRARYDLCKKKKNDHIDSKNGESVDGPIEGKGEMTQMNCWLRRTSGKIECDVSANVNKESLGTACFLDQPLPAPPFLMK